MRSGERTRTPPMHPIDPSSPVALPLSMLIVFGAAKLFAELFERLGQPGVAGEIVAGILVGPAVLGWIAPTDLLTALGNLGAMFLLFRVGLDVRSSDLLEAGGIATLAATLGVAVQFLLSFGVLIAWGEGRMEAAFVAAALAATSVGITAQVLRSRGLLQTRAARIILAAAVIDDVEGLLLLAVASSMARGALNLVQLAITAALAIGFTLAVARWGARSVSRVLPSVQEKLRVGEARFALAMVLLFALAVLAIYMGVAAIVGAFLAGMPLSESIGPRTKDLSQGVTELLAPFFLAGVGLRVDPGSFAGGMGLLLAGVLLAIAVISKVVGCGLGALRLGRADALRVGVGMIPRGEVGMAVAQLGLAAGIIAHGVYSAVVLVAVATTLLAPPLMKLAFRGAAPQGAAEDQSFHLG